VSRAAARADADGLVLGRYRPLRPLGSGGSGSVWLARDERNGLDVALKVVAREGQAAARAEREAHAAARLRHERCLRAYALARDPRHVYIAYEYVPGRTLREALRDDGLDDATAVEVAVQVLDGLAHAHGRGVLHRDVKPANVLLADGEGVSVRLLDFGLAAIEDARTLTALGDVPGTLAYIAPERLQGQPATPASDVWAVGVMLWEALAGEHPFWKPSVVESARAIEEGAPRLASSRPDLPEPLLAAVDRSLAGDPARRPDADRLAHALRNAVADARPVRRGGGPSAGELTAHARRLAPAALAALAAGGVAAGLPFYPEYVAPVLAALAGTAAFVRPRVGLALVLATAVMPLGNIALGLALLYAAAAALWLAAFWREPRFALLPAVGALLAPVAALPLVVLLVQPIRSPLRRAAVAAAAVLVAALTAGVRGAALPLTGEHAQARLDVDAVESPVRVAAALAEAAVSEPGLVALACALALASAFLRRALALGGYGIAALGSALLAVTLLPARELEPVPVVGATWLLCALLWAYGPRERVEAVQTRS
jgi:hypothetical protein